MPAHPRPVVRGEAVNHESRSYGPPEAHVGRDQDGPASRSQVVEGAEKDYGGEEDETGHQTSPQPHAQWFPGGSGKGRANSRRHIPTTSYQGAAGAGSGAPDGDEDAAPARSRP